MDRGSSSVIDSSEFIICNNNHPHKIKCVEWVNSASGSVKTKRTNLLSKQSLAMNCVVNHAGELALKNIPVKECESKPVSDTISAGKCEEELVPRTIPIEECGCKNGYIILFGVCISHIADSDNCIKFEFLKSLAIKMVPEHCSSLAEQLQLNEVQETFGHLTLASK